MSEAKFRQVNKVESFIPSEESKIIIKYLMAVMTKSGVYNSIIETYGKQFAAEKLSNEDFLKMLKELELLKV